MNAYSVEFTKQANKDIKKLDNRTKKRLLAKLRYFVALDDPLELARHLKDQAEGSYRWRVGSYRIVFDVEDNVLVILRVQHRREVYRS